MNPTLVFTVKEFHESIRTARLLIVCTVFIIFGLMGPIIAKILPEMLPQMLKEAGIPEFTLKTTAIDAWVQYLKNCYQMGVLATILVFMGAVSDERNKGSALIVLTKPLSRTGFILAKFIGAAVILLLSIWLGFLTCMYYTDIVFGSSAVKAAVGPAVLFSGYALLVLSLTLFASCVSPNSGISAGVSLAGLAIFGASSYEGLGLSRWSPGALSGLGNSILTGKADIAKAYPALAVALVCTVLLVISTSIVMNRKET